MVVQQPACTPASENAPTTAAIMGKPAVIAPVASSNARVAADDGEQPEEVSED